MKRILAGILSISMLSNVFACYNDSDSRYYERFSMPNDMELSEGDFPTHSKYYFEWKIQDRLLKISKDSKNLDLYDDLAVAYEKSGQANKGIEVMLKVLQKNPERYSSLSNLGTFYIHEGNYKEGLYYLNKAIKINPKSHFEREKYQIKLIEYIQQLNVKPPFSFPIQDIKSKKDFADYIIQGINDKKEQEKELIHAIVGVSGMIKFGMKNSSLLMEAMGDLYLKIMIINDLTDEDAIKSYHYIIANYYNTASNLSQHKKIDIYDFLPEKSLNSIEKSSIGYAVNNYIHYSNDKFEQVEKEIIDSKIKNVEETINEQLYPGEKEKETGQTKDLFEEKYNQIQEVKKEYLREIKENNGFKRNIYKLTSEKYVIFLLYFSSILLTLGYMYEIYLLFSEKKKYINNSLLLRVKSSFILLLLISTIATIYLCNLIKEEYLIYFMLLIGFSFLFNIFSGLSIIHHEKNEQEYKNYCQTLKLYKAVKYSSWLIRITIVLPILLLIIHGIIGLNLR